MNIYFIILIAWIASLAGFGLYENHAGHVSGVNEQKVVDQKEFDKINAERTQQKAEAAKLLQNAQAGIITLQQERDKLKTTLGEQDAKNRKDVLVLNANLASARLRFRTAQGAGDRTDSGGSLPSTSNPASAQPAPIVQLPDALAEDLRRFALDADLLAADYKLCYGYATKVR